MLTCSDSLWSALHSRLAKQVIEYDFNELVGLWNLALIFIQVPVYFSILWKLWCVWGLG